MAKEGIGAMILENLPALGILAAAGIGLYIVYKIFSGNGAGSSGSDTTTAAPSLAAAPQQNPYAG